MTIPAQSTQRIVLSGVQSRQHDLALQSLPVNERTRGDVKQRQGAAVDHHQEGDTGTRVSRGRSRFEREQEAAGRAASVREAAERLSRQTGELRRRTGARDASLLSQARVQNRAEVSQ